MKGNKNTSNGDLDAELARLMPQIVEASRQWILEQRDLYSATARSISDDERLSLQDYYDRRILDTVRIATVDQITNPPFYGEITELGIPILDISSAAGITFMDCIVIQRLFEQQFPLWISILFHELVHVIQYNFLGPRKLIDLYLRAWIQNGYQYDSVLFEAQAYRLESRFKQNGPSFSVRAIVEQELKGMV